jgi:hypothetical protein
VLLGASGCLGLIAEIEVHLHALQRRVQVIDVVAEAAYVVLLVGLPVAMKKFSTKLRLTCDDPEPYG